MKRVRLALVGLVGAGLMSCVPGGSTEASPHRYGSADQVRVAVKSGPNRLKAMSEQLDEIRRDFAAVERQKGAGWRKRGYLIAGESDRMEVLLFRFTTAQDVLSDLVGSLGGKPSAKLFPEASLRTAAHVLVTNAQFLQMHHRAELVATFAEDPVAVAKLNEAFYRSEIPAGTYDKLRMSVTSEDVAERLNAAWVLFEEESREGEIGELVSVDPEYAGLVKRMPTDHRNAEASLAKVQGRGALDRLTHSEAAALARKTRGGLGDLKYKARCLLFKDVSRIKNPRIKVISFSAAQHAQVKGILQPGDIILTYTAGYMSDVFIPGSFKHGITYIGSPEQRKAVGLDKGVLPEAATTEAEAVAFEFSRARLPDGQEVDVIEAVAEGVIFNNLGHLMDTHVNRMAVLRPRLSPRDRAEFLADVFAYHGDAYDFLFDFGDASRQVCTEVIYRGINGRRGISFPLTRRGGHPTLSADDVVNYHFKTGGRYFEFVLYAGEDASRAGHRAVIHTGAEGEATLRRLMEGER